MGSNQTKYCLILVVCLSLFATLSASTPISRYVNADAIFGPRVASQRRLLQAIKPCPVDFEHQNYTVFKKCKSPYSVELCCSALVEFTCPFVDYVDDLTTDCAQVMFDTINVREGYPPALFASLCKEGKEGLACPAPPQAPPSMAAAAAVKNVESCGGSIICELFIVIMLVFSMIM